VDGDDSSPPFHLCIEEDGTSFLLTLIDVFSKKAWVRPLKSKGGFGVAAAIGDVLSTVAIDESTPNFRSLQTDKGKEFLNRHVRAVLSRYGLRHFTSENETLRGRLHRLIFSRNDKMYIDNLQDIVQAYNTSTHSTTGMAPSDMTFANQEDVWSRKRERDTSHLNRRKRPTLSPGDHVLISMARSSFERGFTPNWSTEVFVVDKVLENENPVVYTLVDLNGEAVTGTFYALELQRVTLPEEFKIEEVLRRRRRRGRTQLFVKWMGYPSSFNSWIDESDLV